MKTIPPFLRQQLRTLSATGADGAVYGLDEGWSAPLALYQSSTGFGEAHWVSAQPDTVLAIALNGSLIVSHCPDTRGRTGQPFQDVFTLQPQGTPNHFVAADAVEFAHVILSDAMIRQVGDDLGINGASSAMLRPDLAFVEDKEMYDWIQGYVARGIDPENPPSRLEMEARMLLITERLLSRYHQETPQRHRIVQPAMDWRIRRSIEEIEARLHEDLGLIELAAAVGLSPSHYAMLFRAATGLPPHRWLVKRRIERACEMLHDPRTSITDIAFTLGFPSSQHFATMFGKHMGATPSEWRRRRMM